MHGSFINTTEYEILGYAVMAAILDLWHLVCHLRLQGLLHTVSRVINPVLISYSVVRRSSPAASSLLPSELIGLTRFNVFSRSHHLDVLVTSPARPFTVRVGFSFAQFEYSDSGQIVQLIYFIIYLSQVIRHQFIVLCHLLNGHWTIETINAGCAELLW